MYSHIEQCCLATYGSHVVNAKLYEFDSFREIKEILFPRLNTSPRSRPRMRRHSILSWRFETFCGACDVVCLVCCMWKRVDRRVIKKFQFDISICYDFGSDKTSWLQNYNDYPPEAKFRREQENSNKIPAEARVKKGNAAPADVKKASKTGQKGVSKASKKGVFYLGVHRQPKKMLTWDSDDSLAGPRAKRSKKGRAKGQAKWKEFYI